MNMKKITAQLSIAILLVAGAASCKKNRLILIRTRTRLQDGTTIVYNVICLLPRITRPFGGRNWGWLQNYMGYWAGSGTAAPNTQEETYTLTTSFRGSRSGLLCMT